MIYNGIQNEIQETIPDEIFCLIQKKKLSDKGKDTMQFRRALCNMLRKQGYESIPETDGLCWRMRGDGEIWIVQLVPEHLPGQALIPLQERDRWGREVERRQMIMEGCRTDRQMLILLSDRPSEEQIRELERFPHAWYLDKNDGAVYLYENQRGDFHHLREATEIFSQEYVRGKKEHDRLEMKKMFTPVNTVLIVLNVLIFLGLSLLGDTENAEFMNRYGALSWDAVVLKGEYYRFLTSMFLHFGASHLLQNMVILAVLGRRLERLTGSWKYLILYFASGIASSLASFYFTLHGNPYVVCGGASGAIFGVMGGLLALILKDYMTGNRRRTGEIGLRGMVFMIACAVSYGFTSTNVDNAAHLGGLAAGFLLMSLLDFVPDFSKKRV